MPENILVPTAGPELVFGLVGPIGTNLQAVAQTLENELSRVGYTAVHVHLSDAFQEIGGGEFTLTETPVEARYRSYMDAGNHLRKRLQHQDALALFAVSAIRRKRLELTSKRDTPALRTAYILNQLKRPEEIETLRRVYGRGFVQVSAYCSQEKRLDVLTEKIAQSHYRERNKEAYRAEAQRLISADDAEEENIFGQRVRDAFPLADVMISAENEPDIRRTCSRFIQAFFGDNFCTPSRDEYGIYLASAAALRSADLSRQVGAAIFSPSGEILSLGSNEVPRAGGGAYWEGDDDDYRDFQAGEDSSVRVKREILEDIFRRLSAGKWLAQDKSGVAIDTLVSSALHKEKGVLRDAQVTDILEFGRIVHAEMSAISSAARQGLALQDATLYCTTFPCHICARHIVACGIKRVVYIEPYVKSLAADLYPDSIAVEGRRKRRGPKVEFMPFMGIAPERYSEVFAKGKRKTDTGKAIIWNQKSAKPILERLYPAYLDIETIVIEAVNTLLETKGVVLHGGNDHA